jgi:hypothetical protein
MKQERKKALPKQNPAVTRKAPTDLVAIRKKKRELLGPEFFSERLKRLLQGPGSEDEKVAKRRALRASCAIAMRNEGTNPPAVRNTAFLDDAQRTMQSLDGRRKRKAEDMEPGTTWEQDDGRDQAHRPRTNMKEYLSPMPDLSYVDYIRKEGHEFGDEHCIDELMKKLKTQGSVMRVLGFNLGEDGKGRFYNDWPSPLHVNRKIRAAIFMLERAHYTDMDMQKAHVNICLFFAGLLGVAVPFIEGTAAFMPRLQAHMQARGFKEGDVKELVLRYLNFGVWTKWLEEVQEKQNIHGAARANSPMNKSAFEPWVREHLNGLAADVKRLSRALRDRGEEHWHKIFTEMEQRKPTVRKGEFQKNVARSRAEKNKCHKRAWNRCLTTVESAVMKVLELLIESGIGDMRNTGEAPIVAVPCYDGLLIRHEADAFDVGALQEAWERKSLEVFGFHFPIAAKDWWKELLQQSWAQKYLDSVDWKKEADTADREETKVLSCHLNMECDDEEFEARAAREMAKAMEELEVRAARETAKAKEEFEARRAREVAKEKEELYVRMAREMAEATKERARLVAAKADAEAQAEALVLLPFRDIVELD